MSLCLPDQRERVRAAVEQLTADPRVAGAVAIEPDTDPTARWTVDAVLDMVHSRLDEQLIRATSGELRQRLEDMRKAVSPECFDGRVASSDECQRGLTDGSEGLRHFI